MNFLNSPRLNQFTGLSDTHEQNQRTMSDATEAALRAQTYIAGKEIEGDAMVRAAREQAKAQRTGGFLNAGLGLLGKLLPFG